MTRAAAWLALLAIGQAAAVSMIDAGQSMHYQHYPPLPELIRIAPWALGIVLAQTLIVLVAAARWWRAWRTQRPPAGPAMRVAAALLFATSTAATVSADPLRYADELAFAAFLQILAVVTLVFAAASVPADALGRFSGWLDRILGSTHEPSPDGLRLDRFAWVAATVAAMLAIALNVLSYERHPHVPDEVVYQHHARYFAEGMLTMPAAPVPAAFDVDLMEYEPTRWYSPVPPGWPAVLALGALIGAPWIINPLLTGANVLLVYMFLGQLYPKRMTRGATALLAVSPWFLFLGMSLMTHQFTLTCALVAAVGVTRARRSGGLGWGLLAGIGVGATSLIRPLDGVIVGSLIAAWSVGLGGTRLRFASLAGLAVGTAVVGAMVLPYNLAITGDPLRFPINAYVDGHYAPNSNAFGFGPDRGMGWAIDPNPGHGPVDGIINANLNVFGINTDLFGWATGSLIFIAWLFCSGAARRRDGLMVAPILAFAGTYFLYYFSGGPDFGARYWFPAVVPLAVLTARGVEVLDRTTNGRAWPAAVALSALAVILYVPWRGVDKYHDYRGMRADIRALAATHEFGDSLVLVRGRRFPDYASAFVQNPIDLTGRGAIYAWDRDADVRAALLRAYGDRPVWVVEGPSITGNGYRVAQGPVAADVLLSAGVNR